MALGRCDIRVDDLDCSSKLLTGPKVNNLLCIMHHLQERDVCPLYARGATAGAKVTAQQLQALHTENLQLRSLLKQEVKARQQLEHQHAALVALLRCAVFAERRETCEMTKNVRIVSSLICKQSGVATARGSD